MLRNSWFSITKTNGLYESYRKNISSKFKYCEIAHRLITNSTNSESDDLKDTGPLMCFATLRRITNTSPRMAERGAIRRIPRLGGRDLSFKKKTTNGLSRPVWSITVSSINHMVGRLVLDLDRDLYLWIKMLSRRGWRLP